VLIDFDKAPDKAPDKVYSTPGGGLTNHSQLHQKAGSPSLPFDIDTKKYILLAMQTEKLCEINPWKSMFDAAEHFSSDFMSTREPGIESTRESFDECEIPIENRAH